MQLLVLELAVLSFPFFCAGAAFSLGQELGAFPVSMFISAARLWLFFLSVVEGGFTSLAIPFFSVNTDKLVLVWRSG